MTHKRSVFRKRIAHMIFDWRLFHIFPRSKSELITELLEIPFLAYRALGFFLGLAMVAYPQYALGIFVAFAFWLMFDLRLTFEQDEK